MPLQFFYAQETDVPENLKGAYVARNGRYELDKLSDDHPSVVALNEIKQKHETLRNQNAELIQDKTRLESGALPEGKVAVEPEIEKLGLAAKEAGLKQTELKTLKTDLAAANEKLADTERGQHASRAAKLLGFNDKFTALAKKESLNFEFETADGKESVFILDDKGEKQKPEDFIKSNELFSSFADTFKGEKESGFEWIDQESGKDKKAPPTIEREQKALIGKGIYNL